MLNLTIYFRKIVEKEARSNETLGLAIFPYLADCGVFLRIRSPAGGCHGAALRGPEGRRPLSSQGVGGPCVASRSSQVRSPAYRFWFERSAGRPVV
jgi:hypothetical protein